MSDLMYWRLALLAGIAFGLVFGGTFASEPWHGLMVFIGAGLLGFTLGITFAVNTVIATLGDLKAEVALRQNYASWGVTDGVKRLNEVIEDVPEAGPVDGGPGVGEPNRP